MKNYESYISNFPLQKNNINNDNSNNNHNHNHNHNNNFSFYEHFIKVSSLRKIKNDFKFSV